MTELGVSDQHEAQLVNYMRFEKYQRGQRLRAVDMCFEDLKGSRLVDDTYTIDELTEMLDGLLTLVRSEVDEELINTTHTNVLLLMQLFKQAEEWHLTLKADISELENRELLDKIKTFENSGYKSDKKEAGARLQPMNDAGGAPLLKMKIQELEEEKTKLLAQISRLEKTAEEHQREKATLASKLGKTQNEMSQLMAAQQRAEDNQSDLQMMRSKINELEAALGKKAKDTTDRDSSREADLANTKHELLRVSDLLKMAEKELEKKVYQTRPYQNMKQMMQKKNDQIKELRKRLAKYEPDGDY